MKKIIFLILFLTSFMFMDAQGYRVEIVGACEVEVLDYQRERYEWYGISRVYENKVDLYSDAGALTLPYSKIVSPDTTNEYFFTLFKEQKKKCVGDGNSITAVSSSALISGANIDNAGRLEVTNNTALGEFVFDIDSLPLAFDAVEINGAKIHYDADTNGMVLRTFDGSIDTAIYQSKQWHPYFPGHAQQAEFTFIDFTPQQKVTKRVGYYHTDTVPPYGSGLDGIYLESRDSVVYFGISKNDADTLIAQENWLDPLDGLGASMQTINWDNFQVFQIDFLYLGGTTVNLYWITNGRKYLVAQYHHSNQFAQTIVDYPSQPIRAEIIGNDTTGHFIFICAQVSTSGGGLDFSGVPIGFDTGNSTISLATAGTEYAVMSLRKEDRPVEVFIRDLVIVSTAGATEAFRWRVLLNPTTSAGLTWTSVPNAGVEGGVGDGTQTISSSGKVLAAGVGISRSAVYAPLTNAYRIGSTIAGVGDSLYLAITPMTNTQTITAAENVNIIK